MSTDSDSAVNGNGYAREPRGRFARGNRGGPGRRKGPTPTTTSLERIKRALIDSWHQVDGPALLRDLAKSSPREYLRLVVGLLPREQRVEYEHRQLVLNVIDAPLPVATEIESCVVRAPRVERTATYPTYRSAPRLADRSQA